MPKKEEELEEEDVSKKKNECIAFVDELYNNYEKVKQEKIKINEMNNDILKTLERKDEVIRLNCLAIEKLEERLEKNEKVLEETKRRSEIMERRAIDYKRHFNGVCDEVLVLAEDANGNIADMPKSLQQLKFALKNKFGDFHSRLAESASTISTLQDATRQLVSKLEKSETLLDESKRKLHNFRLKCKAMYEEIGIHDDDDKIDDTTEPTSTTSKRVRVEDEYGSTGELVDYELELDNKRQCLSSGNEETEYVMHSTSSFIIIDSESTLSQTEI